MTYGYPFLTSIPKNAPAGSVALFVEKLLGINVNFFGAYVGGDKRLGHSVVFYVPEGKFYFLDPAVNVFVPTTEDKIRLGLSLTLQRHAGGLPVNQAQTILKEYCSPATLDEIIYKAKTLLSVDRGFFEGPHANRRVIVEDEAAKRVAVTVRSFIETQIEADDGGVLTITECFEYLQSYLGHQGTALNGIKGLREVLRDKIREVYGKGLRNDLVLPGEKCAMGWKGLNLRPNRPLNLFQHNGETEVSGDSVDSVTDSREPFCLKEKINAN